MKKEKVHFIGIGGSGESAVCGIALSMGYEVSGCDQNLKSDYLDKLLEKYPKIPLYEKHLPSHLENIDLVAISPAITKIDPKNLELKAARDNKIPIVTWQEFMGKFLQRGKFVISIAGTHGKSTVTSMIGHLLEDAKLDPIVELGALDISWGINFRTGNGKYFVNEADEYNDNFLNYKPNVLVITNIEMDHPDYFKNTSQIVESLKKLINQMEAPKIVICKKKYASFFQSTKGISFIFPQNKALNLSVIGNHNKDNAQFCFSVGRVLGINENLIKKSLGDYKGISRRLEYRGETKKAKVFDDFAHHPTEVKASLKALKQAFPSRKILVIFEPHTFSRTKKFLTAFSQVFSKLSDLTLVTDIFPAREIDEKKVNSKDLVDKIGSKAKYLPTLEEAVEYAKNQASKDYVIVFMGAGRIFQGIDLLNKNE